VERTIHCEVASFNEAWQAWQNEIVQQEETEKTEHFLQIEHEDDFRRSQRSH
jgi:hypothetical protein